MSVLRAVVGVLGPLGLVIWLIRSHRVQKRVAEGRPHPTDPPATRVVCPSCKQNNIQFPGWHALIYSGPLSQLSCKFCGADLATGKHGFLGRLMGGILMLAFYSLHAAAIGTALALAVVLLYPRLWDQPRFVRMSPLLLGATVGIAIAERARRRGRLVT